MKKLVLLLISFFVFLSAKTQNYYYSGGKQIFLQVDTTQVVLYFFSKTSVQTVQQKVANIDKSLNISGLQLTGGGENIHYQ
ncbi:hypothetical protein [Raineya sp.]|jgi:hypothetical protein